VFQEVFMRLVYALLTLSNPRDPALRPLEVSALVDTGALHLCLPPHVVSQLQLETLEYREARIADGSVHRVPYVGPVKVAFDNRQCYVGALVLGNEVLLGAVPMEDMDVLISPARQELIVNPANPNMAVSVVK
jgi:clan AA aspartic protease